MEKNLILVSSWQFSTYVPWYTGIVYRANHEFWKLFISLAPKVGNEKFRICLFYEYNLRALYGTANHFEEPISK